MRRRLFAATLALTGALTGALCAADTNARWDFLRMNLQVFPGTEKIFEADDALFWKLKPNLRRVRASEKLPNAPELPFRVSTDGAGRRLTVEAKDSSTTVLFLGDSCTFGIPVEDEEAFPARVGALTGARAINAGVPGYSAFQGRLVLENALLTEKPDAVVITFWVNGRTVWDHLSDAEHQELMAAERAGEMSRHRVMRLLRRVLPEGRPRLTDEEFAEQIRAMVGMADAAGAQPLIVIWPAAVQLDGGEEHPRQALLRRIAGEMKTPLVDPLEAFRAKGGERLYVDAVHATAAGYDVAAREIADALRTIDENPRQP